MEILFPELYGQEGPLQVHKVSIERFLFNLLILVILLYGVQCIKPTHGYSELSVKEGSRHNAEIPGSKSDIRPLLSLSSTPKLNVIKVGKEITLTVSVDRIEGLYSAPFYLIYDPSLLEFIKASEGNFLKKDGKQTTFFQVNNPETGQVIIGLSRLGQAGGVTGSGPLATFTFRAKSSGIGKFSIQKPEFRNADMEIIPLKVVLDEVKIE